MVGRKKWEKKPKTMSLRKHRLLGVSSRNSIEKQIISRLLNIQMERDKKIKDARKEPVFGSIKELMQAENKR